MNRVDLNWVLLFRVDGSVKPNRLKEIWALCILTLYNDHCDSGLTNYNVKKQNRTLLLEPRGERAMISRS